MNENNIRKVILRLGALFESKNFKAVYGDDIGQYENDIAILVSFSKAINFGTAKIVVDYRGGLDNE